MSVSPYAVRNYRPSDYDDYVKFKTATAELSPDVENSTPEAIEETFRRPGYSPEEDLLLATRAGEIIGFTEIIPELASQRVILDCFILPEHRGKGLEETLLDQATRRGKELGAKAARINVREEDSATQRRLPELGFRKVKRYFDLKLSLGEAEIPDAATSAYSIRHLQPGDEEELTRLQNRSFADNWEYNPNTAEEIAGHFNRKRSSPEDVLLIYDAGRPAGYCWTKIRSASGRGKKTGRIHMLGVDRDYRRQGLGRLALCCGLRYLKSRGVRSVWLTVDSTNASALALYRSAGFKEWTSSFWYEKKLG